jgi:hypothetical protein
MKSVQGDPEQKAGTTAYWIVTLLLCAELLTGGTWDLLRTSYVVGIMNRLGYPLYVLTIIGLWKILVVPALLAAGLPRLKEWAYAGIFFDMSGAVISHAARGESSAVIAPLLIAVFAMVSWKLRPQSRVCGNAMASAKA